MMDLIGCSALGAWADVFALFSIEAVVDARERLMPSTLIRQRPPGLEQSLPGDLRSGSVWSTPTDRIAHRLAVSSLVGCRFDATDEDRLLIASGVPFEE